MGWGLKRLARMGGENFIDRWVDNKSYQYSLPIYKLILKKSISASLRDGLKRVKWYVLEGPADAQGFCSCLCSFPAGPTRCGRISPGHAYSVCKRRGPFSSPTARFASPLALGLN